MTDRARRRRRGAIRTSRARAARPFRRLLTLKSGEWLRDEARDESDSEASPGRLGGRLVFIQPVV